MLLGDEKCIKVPESSLNEAICWHFLETHLKEDLSELVSDLVQRMQCTGILICSERFEVVGLEGSGLPRTTIKINDWTRNF
jgi:hypothetical protein